MAMRNLYSILLFFFLSSALCGGQEKASPFLFEETSFDFGTAREDGGRLVHVYRFTNVSQDTAMITGIRSLCRCTRGEASARVVPPGAKGLITVTFDPYGYTGEQHKGVTVVTDRKSEDRLTFSVSLVPRRKTVEEEFPVDAGAGLRIDKTEFDFLQVAAGQSRTISLHFVNVSSQVLHLKALTVSSGGLLSVSCPQAALPGERGEIAMTYAPDIGSVGFHSDSFVLLAGDGGKKVEIRSRVVATDDFSGLSGSSPRPLMRIGSTYVNVGQLQASSETRRISYTVKNEGTAPLSIRDLYCPEGLSATIGKGTSVAPGASLHFDVMLNAMQIPEGAFFGTVRILTDDPSCPVKDLMIAARIVK